MGIAILTSSNASWPWTTTGGQTVVKAELLGGGGGGGGVSNNTEEAGGGGKGGAYVTVTLTKGAESTLNITVGAFGAAGAAAGGNGGDGGFSEINQNSTVVARAPGGQGGVGGTTNAGHLGGTTENGTEVHTGGSYFAGGNGADGNITSNFSGGGGGAAGPSGAGSAGSSQNGGARGTGTWADGSTTRNTAGANGKTTAAAGDTAADFGGGGGGGYATSATNRAGGAGGAGIVVLTWVDLPPQYIEDSYRTAQRPILDVRRQEWAPLFISVAALPTPGGGGPSAPTGIPFLVRRVIERTTGPAQVFTTIVDQTVRTWIPATAALLACAVPATAAHKDVRYDTAPTTVFVPLGPTPPTDAQNVPAIQETAQSFRTAARPVLDIQNYDWSQPVVPVSIVVDPTVAKWAPAFSGELAGERIRARPALDVRAYEWAPSASSWIQANLTAGPSVAQTAPAWTDKGGRTDDRARLDVRRHEWASDESPWINTEEATDAAHLWPAIDPDYASYRTPERNKLDVRRYDWPPDESGWIQVNLPQGPTVAQTAPAWANHAQNFRVSVRRWLYGLGTSEGHTRDGGTPVTPVTPPTVAQTVPAFVTSGERTRDGKKLDLFRAQSIPDIFGVPDNWIDWVHQQDRGGLTRDRARLDVRRYEWGQPVYTATLPASDTSTVPQRVPAFAFDGDRTSSRATLDVRTYDWSPEFGWVQPVANAAVISWSGIFSGELTSFRTPDDPRLDVRRYEWVAWVQGVAAPAATVAQTAPAWIDTGGLTRDRLRLDVRRYEWTPAFSWVQPVVNASIAQLSGVFSGELATFRTNDRARLDVRTYKWAPDEAAWELINFAPPVTVPQIWPALLENLGTEYQTAARAKLDVRSYEWAPEFTWAAKVVDPIVARWQPVFDAERSQWTPSRARLNVRALTDAPELAWQITVVSVAQQLEPLNRADVVAINVVTYSVEAIQESHSVHSIEDSYTVTRLP